MGDSAFFPQLLRISVHRWFQQLWQGGTAFSRLNVERVCLILDRMSRTKKPGTGEGYIGAIMVHRITRAVGIVEHVLVARDGWPPELTLKLPDGSLRKGKLGDFREPTGTERKAFPQE